MSDALFVQFVEYADTHDAYVSTIHEVVSIFCIVQDHPEFVDQTYVIVADATSTLLGLYHPDPLNILAVAFSVAQVTGLCTSNPGVQFVSNDASDVFGDIVIIAKNRI